MAFNQRYLAYAGQVIDNATLATAHGSNLQEIALWQALAMGAPNMVELLLSPHVPPVVTDALRAQVVEIVVTGSVEQGNTMDIHVRMQKVQATLPNLEIARSLSPEAP